MTLDRTVPPFAPIGLAELLARAELLTRTDRKYLLPGADLPVLLRALPTGTRVLEIDGRRRFAYRSAYFDTPGLDSYLASARRRRRRFKLRVRGYLDTGQQFVELKTRGARNTTVKSRFPYAGSADRLDPATRDLASSLLAAAAMPPVTGEFQLTLVTTYERMTLILPGTATRVTVDRELAWQLP
ncbi:VTC domain-containing protein, partial [Actinoplanes sp. RD1]|uniref:VTC domain-containing protein n=1 Tax=Actinoplanes sp. RD1 TaxID=3064538 RepID=UPI002742483F